MDTILPLTPSPVILVKNLRELLDWNSINKELIKQRWTNDGNYQITPKNFLENLPEIKKILVTEAKEFIQNTAAINFNFNIKITNSWVNKINTGDQHPWHTHPFSVVSGVLFLDNHPENSNLFFKKDLDFLVPPYSLLETNYTVSLNDLIENYSEDKDLQYHLVLFYSNINHCVPVLSTLNLERKTLSFNSFWKGRVDFGTDLNSFDFDNE